MKSYECRIDSEGANKRIILVVRQPESEEIDVEVSANIKEAIDDLQREYWRLEKREQRHTVHIEAIPECFIPHDRFAESPEALMLKKHDAQQVTQALSQIPIKQQRRLMLRYVFELPIKKIAKIENCSERSVKYSLSLAKKNLKDLLGDDFLDV